MPRRRTQNEEPLLAAGLHERDFKSSYPTPLLMLFGMGRGNASEGLHTAVEERYRADGYLHWPG